MRLIYAGIALTIATLGFADTITLKSGNVINGTYLGGTARQVRVRSGDRIRTLDVTRYQPDRIRRSPRRRHRRQADERPSLRGTKAT